MDKNEAALQHRPNAAEIINMFQPVFDTLKQLRNRDDTIIKTVEAKLTYEVEQLARRYEKDYQLNADRQSDEYCALRDRVTAIEQLLGQK